MSKPFAAMTLPGFLAILLLAACGGGGQPPENQDPQGFWKGRSASGFDIAAVVLENGDYYSLYAKNGLVYGANYGTVDVYGTSFAGSLGDVFIPGNQANSGTISGTFVPKSTLQGIASYNDNTVGAFTTSYDADYDTPATLGAIAGRYAGEYKSGGIVDLQIASDGAVNGTTAAPLVSPLPKCVITGSALPRPSGKNVYDLTLKWSNNPDPAAPRCCLGTTCATGTPTAGVAILDSTEGVPYLYTAWINSAKTSGFLWIGRKL